MKLKLLPGRFWDSSEVGGAAIYVRFKLSHGIRANLLTAKRKVILLKKMTTS